MEINRQCIAIPAVVPIEIISADLSSDEKIVYLILYDLEVRQVKDRIKKTAEAMGMTIEKVQEILNVLIDREVIELDGSGAPAGFFVTDGMSETYRRILK